MSKEPKRSETIRSFIIPFRVFLSTVNGSNVHENITKIFEIIL